MYWLEFVQRNLKATHEIDPAPPPSMWPVGLPLVYKDVGYALGWAITGVQPYKGDTACAALAGLDSNSTTIPRAAPWAVAVSPLQGWISQFHSDHSLPPFRPVTPGIIKFCESSGRAGGLP